MGSLINWKKETPSTTERALSPFFSLQHNLDKAMHDFYNIFETQQLSSKDLDTLTLNPLVNIVDDNETFKVEVEMPGIDEEDVQVLINNGMLTIKAEKSVSKKDENKNYIMREIGFGTYERHLALPDYVDADKAEATFKKGMLWINIPKKASTIKQAKKLKVEKAQ